jgi:ABC-type glycerol-3-phosphate transport system substrate-binding protein
MTSGDATDIGIIPAHDLGAWAEHGELVPVPVSLRAADNPYQWTALLPAYREHLIEWGGQACALPLAGEGFVIVYRSDRFTEANFIAAFQKRSMSKPAKPATWEEFADLAAAFAEVDGKPSLPQMSRGELADLFFRLAACYDRPASLSDDAGAGHNLGGGVLSFQHDIRTGDPRLDTPGFHAAADWFAKLAAQKCLPTPTQPGVEPDPASELASGKAMLAVVSLRQLAKMPRENGKIPAKFALAPFPGTQSYVNPQKEQLVRAVAANYIPYTAGGLLGVVRTRCPHTEAAFELLAEVGGPTRSHEIISTPGLGSGPFRTSHLEQDRLQIWLGYGFDADRSKALLAALALNARVDAKNSVHGLRGPDQKELTDAAADELTKIAGGALQASEGLKKLLAHWTEIDKKTPQAVRLRWRKLAAGVE